MARPSFTPEEFVAKLRSGDLETSTSLRLIGMVKEADDEQHLLFANGTSCETWTRLPLAMVEDIELGDMVPCQDHSHPLVRLRIKEPSSEESAVFAALAKAQLTAHPNPSSQLDQAPQIPRNPAAPRGWRGRYESKVLAADGGSCRACWEFCRELTTTPDFDDFLWCLNFCGPLC
jgi:hypothetical protein